MRPSILLELMTFSFWNTPCASRPLWVEQRGAQGKNKKNSGRYARQALVGCRTDDPKRASYLVAGHHIVGASIPRMTIGIQMNYAARAYSPPTTL
jgi:hypothetical protein